VKAVAERVENNYSLVLALCPVSQFFPFSFERLQLTMTAIEQTLALNCDLGLIKLPLILSSLSQVISFISVPDLSDIAAFFS
jgi:hypothetical protein